MKWKLGRVDRCLRSCQWVRMSSDLPATGFADRPFCLPWRFFKDYDYSIYIYVFCIVGFLLAIPRWVFCFPESPTHQNKAGAFTVPSLDFWWPSPIHKHVFAGKPGVQMGFVGVWWHVSHTSTGQHTNIFLKKWKADIWWIRWMLTYYYVIQSTHLRKNIPKASKAEGSSLF